MALKGTNQEYGRPYNRRIVLETIRVQGPIARGEIAKRVGLTVQTVSTIIRELETRGVKYETRAEGQTILAPRPDLPRLRMELAGKGLPSGGGVGYEIFDKGDAFSSTSFHVSHRSAWAVSMPRAEWTREIRSVTPGNSRTSKAPCRPAPPVTGCASPSSRRTTRWRRGSASRRARWRRTRPSPR